MTEPLPAAPAPTPGDDEPDLAFQHTSVIVPDPRDAEIERLRERLAAAQAALRDIDDRAFTSPHETEATCEACQMGKVARDALSGGTSALDAVRAGDKARIAALEAALRCTAQCDHWEECPSAYDEYGDTPDPSDAEAIENCECSVGPAIEALSGGTSALSKALAAERTRTVDAVKARVEGLVRHGRTLGMLVAHDGGDLVFVDKVLAEIEAAREGA